MTGRCKQLRPCIGAANKLYKLSSKSSEIEVRQTAQVDFASAAAPDGFINYLDTVNVGCSRRYVIRGGPGGKSTLIERIADHAVAQARRGSFTVPLNPMPNIL